MWRKKASFLLKILVSLIFLAWALRALDPKIAWQALTTAFWPLILLAYGLDQIYFALQAWRTQRLLRHQGLPLPYGALWRLNFIGHFFTLFLPTSMGGDLVRFWKLSRGESAKSQVAGAIVAERFIAVYAMLLLALSVCLFGYAQLPGEARSFLWIPLSIEAAMTLFLLNRLPLAWLIHRLPGAWLKKKASGLNRFYEGLHRLMGHPGSFFFTLFISLIVQGGGFLVIYLFATALSIQTPFVPFVLYTSLTLLVIMVPFSISGIGIRETGFLFFFSHHLGVEENLTLLLSFFTFSRMLLAGLIGGGFYFFTRSDFEKKEGP